MVGTPTPTPAPAPLAGSTQKDSKTASKTPSITTNSNPEVTGVIRLQSLTSSVLQKLAVVVLHLIHDEKLHFIKHIGSDLYYDESHVVEM